MEKVERTPEFEKKVANQENSTFTSAELDMMTQEEFDKEIPATGPAKPEERDILLHGTGPAREIYEKTGK